MLLRLGVAKAKLAGLKAFVETEYAKEISATASRKRKGEHRK